MSRFATVLDLHGMTSQKISWFHDIWYYTIIIIMIVIIVSHKDPTKTEGFNNIKTAEFNPVNKQIYSNWHT